MHGTESGFNPWSQKIPRATGQLNLGATATEPLSLRAREPQEKPPQWARSPQLEKDHTPQWRPSTAKLIDWLIFLKKKLPEWDEFGN